MTLVRKMRAYNVDEIVGRAAKTYLIKELIKLIFYHSMKSYFT